MDVTFTLLSKYAHFWLQTLVGVQSSIYKHDLRVFILFVVSFDTGGSDSEREPQFPQLADHRSQSGMF